MSKTQKRERFERLQQRISDLKAGYYMGKYNPEQVKMILWFENSYFRMPFEERSEVDRSWNEYYKKCALSPEALLFAEISRAAGSNDTNRIKELQDQARQMLKNGIFEIKRPIGYDPQCWFNTDWCSNYNACKKELGSLEIDEEAVSPITGNAW
jgi:hypothetical protein